MSSLFRPKRKDDKTGKIVTSKTYYVSAQDRDGNWRRVSTHCQSPAAAKIKQKQIEADLAGPKIERMSLEHWLHERLKTLRPELAAKTWRRYGDIINRITGDGSPLHGINVDQVDMASCARYVGHRLQQGLSKRTVAKETAFLTRALRAARKQGLIAANVVAEIRDEIKPSEMEELKGAHKNETTIFYPHEIDAALAEIDRMGNPGLRDAFLLCLYTGLRTGNVLDLTEGMIDLTCDPPVIRFGGHQMKTGIAFTCRLSTVAAEIIRRRHSHSFPETPQRKLFADFRRSWVRVNQRLRDQGRVNGVTWHALRRSFVTYRIAAGVDLKTVHSEVGHETAAMTLDVYAKFIDDDAVTTWAKKNFAWGRAASTGHVRNVSDPPVKSAETQAGA